MTLHYAHRFSHGKWVCVSGTVSEYKSVADALREFISSKEDFYEQATEVEDCPEHYDQTLTGIRVERLDGLLKCCVTDSGKLLVRGSATTLLAAVEAFEFPENAPVTSDHQLSAKHDARRVSDSSIPIWILTY